MRIFIVSFELGASSKAFVEEGFSGGFVNCVVAAPDIRDALNLSESALKEDGYDILCIERATIFDQDDWSHAPNIITLARDAETSSEVFYSDFHVYGS